MSHGRESMSQGDESGEKTVHIKLQRAHTAQINWQRLQRYVTGTITKMCPQLFLYGIFVGETGYVVHLSRFRQ